MSDRVRVKARMFITSGGYPAPLFRRKSNRRVSPALFGCLTNLPVRSGTPLRLGRGGPTLLSRQFPTRQRRCRSHQTSLAIAHTESNSPLPCAIAATGEIKEHPGAPPRSPLPRIFSSGMRRYPGDLVLDPFDQASCDYLGAVAEDLGDARLDLLVNLDPPTLGGGEGPLHSPTQIPREVRNHTRCVPPPSAADVGVPLSLGGREGAQRPPTRNRRGLPPTDPRALTTTQCFRPARQSEPRCRTSARQATSLFR